MKIYTLYYRNTKLYNHSIFVCPNDETAIEAMKLNLMDSKAERFRNQVKDGNVELRALCLFDEEKGIYVEANEKDFEPEGGFVYCGYESTVCNLKDILNDINRNMENPKQDKS